MAEDWRERNRKFSEIADKVEQANSHALLKSDPEAWHQKVKDDNRQREAESREKMNDLRNRYGSPAAGERGATDSKGNSTTRPGGTAGPGSTGPGRAGIGQAERQGATGSSRAHSDAERARLHPEGKTSKPVTLGGGNGNVPGGGAATAAGGKSSRGDRFRDKTKSFLQKHKKKLIGMSIGGGILIPILLMLLFILGSLQIQDFTQDMLAYSFARISRQNARSTQRVVGEELANESEADGGAKKAKFFQGIKDDLTARFYAIPGVQEVADFRDTYSFKEVSKNLGKSMKPVYEQLPADKVTVLRSRRLIGYSFPTSDGVQTVKIPKKGWNPFTNFSNNKNYYTELRNAMNTTLDLHDVRIPTVVRSAAMVTSLRRMGANWGGLIASLFKNKTRLQADAELKRQLAEKVAPKEVPAGLTGDDEKKAAQEAQDAQREAMSNDDEVQRNFPNNGNGQDDAGVSTKAVAVLKRSYDRPKLRKFLVGFAKLGNPIYNIAVPVCLVIDGSKVSPENSQAKSEAMAREAATTDAVAGQQRAGGTININQPMLAAYNDTIGPHLNDSSPMRLAANKPINTLSPANPSASTIGTYKTSTIFDALLGSGGVASVLDGAAGACPVVTNLFFGIGVGILNLTGEAILGFFTGGAEPAAEEGAVVAAEGATDVAVNTIISRIINQFATKEARSDVYSFVKDLGVDTVKQGGLIAGATFLAQMVVKDYSVSVTGAAAGHPFLEENGAGNDYIASTYMQQNTGGVAMTNAAVAQNDQADRNEVLTYNKSQSFTTRYFALSNADSLFSRVGSDILANANHNFVGKSLGSIAQFLRPTTLFSSILGVLSPRAFAGPNTNGTLHYGNVQFGWTQDEENTIDSSSSYLPEENQKVLEDSGKEQTIIDTYGKCFTEPVSTLLDAGDIERLSPDSTDISPTKGTCSPQQLGSHNPDLGDLVFRYRLSMDYDTTMRLQIGLQTAGGTGGN